MSFVTVPVAPPKLTAVKSVADRFAMTASRVATPEPVAEPAATATVAVNATPAVSALNPIVRPLAVAVTGVWAPFVLAL